MNAHLPTVWVCPRVRTLLPLSFRAGFGWPLALAIAACLAAAPLGRAAANEPSLVLRLDGREVAIARDALLTHPAAQDIEIARDPSYDRPMRYRAVPLPALLQGFDLSEQGVFEAAATDGFVAQIPLAPALGRGEARAYVAVEPANAPWPALPGKTKSAGPFYLVWQRGQADGIGAEHWPYMLASLAIMKAPALRWPQIAVAASLAAEDPARAGQAMFVKHCLACHRINGGGASDLGPDLNLPMNPVEYFQPAALRRYLRDPPSVRSWPDQKMPGFPADRLSESELDQLIAYLRHMSGRRQP